MKRYYVHNTEFRRIVCLCSRSRARTQTSREQIHRSRMQSTPHTECQLYQQ